VIVFRKVGTNQQEYYSIKLRNLTVTGFAQTATVDERSETVEFLPRAVELSYRPQKADGSLDGAVVTSGL
jgi:type VI protein secretion system component Hcp